ncbi:MAG: carboxymuconolactone decarboxylase family protein [Planctomycetota bacterium]
MRSIEADWREAALEPRERQLCAWAEKLTLRPGDCDEKDVEELRCAGWTDEEIHRAAQVIAYFNYINRMADGLGVDLEPEMEPDPRFDS